METVELTRAGARMRLPAAPRLAAEAGGALMHSAAVTTLADTAGGLAVLANLPASENIATLDLHIDHLGAARADADLFVHADCHSMDEDVVFVRGTCYQSPSEETVAAFSASFIRGLRRRPSCAQARPATAAAPGKARHRTGPPEASPFAAWLGMGEYHEDGEPRLVLPFADALLGNPQPPALHGGVVAALLEQAGWHYLRTAMGLHAARARLVNLGVDYLRSARPVSTLARCRLTRQGRRVLHLQASAWQDSPERPTAVGRMHFLLAQ